MAPRRRKPRTRSLLEASQILAQQIGPGVGTGIPPTLMTRDPEAPVVPYTGGQNNAPPMGPPGPPAAIQQYPPTGTTTTTTTPVSTLPPSPGMGRGPSTRGGPVPVNRPVGVYNQPAPAGVDANGDYIYAEGVVPQAYNQTRPTESSTIAGQTPTQGAPMPSGFGTTPGAPTSSSSRPSGQYSTVGDIFAEPEPQTTDPTAWYAFHQDRFRKIGNHYGMDPREVAEQEATIAGQIAAQNATRSKAGEPTLTGPEVAGIWKAYQENLVATRDFNPEQSMQPTQPQDTMLTGSDGGNPLARYGVYTPEQIAGIQGAIGQYVTGVSDKYSAQTGFKADPQTAQAYMMQAQALPAINALEGQQKLAQQVYDLEDQVRYYQALQQTGQLVPQQQQEAATGADDTAAAIASIKEQLG